MDEVCDFIKAACDVANTEVYDGCRYIEFSASEDQDLTDVQLAKYICTELKTHLGADVSNIQNTVINDNVIVFFTYKGFTGEVWERSNSRGYHFWVVSV